MYTLETDKLVARYGDRTVLKGIDLKVARGEVRVILGGSGCGKSTLLKHCIGLVMPTEGTVRLLGTDLAKADEPEREAVLSRIGMLFQGGALLNSMTIHDNVALPIHEKEDLPKDVVDEMVKMKLGLVGLGKFGQLTPPELSGGMKKRAALARAMALDPEILFCDEPSAGLDPISAAELDQLILNLKERFGMSLVVVTHELASIETIADQVLMIDKGAVIADGPLQTVKKMNHPMVRSFFDRVGEREETKQSVLEALGHDGPVATVGTASPDRDPKTGHDRLAATGGTASPDRDPKTGHDRLVATGGTASPDRDPKTGHDRLVATGGTASPDRDPKTGPEGAPK